MSLLLLLLLLTGRPDTPTRDQPLMEICDNALDDDQDGLIDLNDPDCDCPVLEPVSLIPNPSFEEMSCCPQSISQLDCAETWIQASTPTTDYIHACGWMGWDQFPPPQPFPEGEGIVGFRDGRVIQGNLDANWKEYAGACLLSPLESGTAYRFQFHIGFVDFVSSPSINITFFGTTDCNNLPFGEGDEDFGCPTNGPGWSRLGSTWVNGNGWVEAEINVTPIQDIHAIAIGPACPGVTSSRSLYYFFDNLVLADQESFEFTISKVGHPCSPDFTLETPADAEFSYQWYKEGVALPGEISPQLSRIHGEGNYQVRLVGENECKITSVYTYNKPVIQNNLEVTICNGDSYSFGPTMFFDPGNYVDTFKNINNCDSIVHLQLKVVDQEIDTITTSILSGEQFSLGGQQFHSAGQYEVTLPSDAPCDSLILLHLDLYTIYFPNAFSPNGDGLNDTFNVFGGNEVVELQNLKIFDRWGGMIYEGKNIPPNASEGWQGKSRGQDVNNGVYLYMAEVLMADGITRQFSGDVIVIR